MYFREIKDHLSEADAVSGIGLIYQQTGEFSKALCYFQSELNIADGINLTTLQARAYSHLGTIYESLGNLQEAIKFQDLNLSLAVQTNDKCAKAVTYSCLGKYIFNSWINIC